MNGARFGRLTVVEVVHSKPRRALCRCECGREKIVAVGSLRNGNTRSCGCLVAERNLETKTTHGMTGSRTYTSWGAMMARCNRPSVINFAHYGGRGIKVCDRWASFVGFLADMGERPAGKTLDRIDTNGNYEPGNCRWATLSEQASNRRPELQGRAKLTIEQVRQIRERVAKGETRAALAAEFGMGESAVCYLVARRTWRWVP